MVQRWHAGYRAVIRRHRAEPNVIRIPRPKRPQVESPRARVILDWVDTCAYIFWLLFAAVLAVLLLIHGWTLTDSLALRLP